MYVQCKNVTIRVLQTVHLGLWTVVIGSIPIARMLTGAMRVFFPLIDSVSWKLLPREVPNLCFMQNSLLPWWGMLLIGRQDSAIFIWKWWYATE